MVDKQVLMQELEQKFVQIQKELRFKSSFVEIDSLFFIKDSILSSEFVSDNFSRQLCSRIVETYSGWINYLHTLLIPNPQSMINLNESKIFSQEEKTEIGKLIGGGMHFASWNNLNGLTKDKKQEGLFIDDAVNYWNTFFGPKLIEVMAKVTDKWNESRN